MNEQIKINNETFFVDRLFYKELFVVEKKHNGSVSVWACRDKEELIDFAQEECTDHALYVKWTHESFKECFGDDEYLTEEAEELKKLIADNKVVIEAFTSSGVEFFEKEDAPTIYEAAKDFLFKNTMSYELAENLDEAIEIAKTNRHMLKLLIEYDILIKDS